MEYDDGYDEDGQKPQPNAELTAFMKDFESGLLTKIPDILANDVSAIKAPTVNEIESAAVFMHRNATKAKEIVTRTSPHSVSEERFVFSYQNAQQVILESTLREVLAKGNRYINIEMVSNRQKSLAESRFIAELYKSDLIEPTDDFWSEDVNADEKVKYKFTEDGRAAYYDLLRMERARGSLYTETLTKLAKQDNDMQAMIASHTKEQSKQLEELMRGLFGVDVPQKKSSLVSKLKNFLTGRRSARKQDS